MKRWERRRTLGQPLLKEEAEEFLRGYLADGPKPQTDIKAAAEGAGVAWATVRRAGRDRLGVTVRKDGMTGPWLWRCRRKANHPKMLMSGK